MATLNDAAGNPTGVTSDLRAMTESVVRPYSAAVAMEKGWAFACADSTVTPTAGNDVFCKIGNISTDLLVVTMIHANAATGSEVISIQPSIAYASATSHAEKTAVNLLAGSANLFTTKGTFESDVDITGDAVTVADQIAHMNLKAADTDYTLDLSGNPIVIPNGYCLLLEAVTGGLAIGYTVFCHFAMVPYQD
jgi:hypothetical protein